MDVRMIKSAMDPHIIQSYFSHNLLGDIVPQRLFDISLDAVVKHFKDYYDTVLVQLGVPTLIIDLILQKLPDDEAINIINKLNPSISKVSRVKLKNMPDNNSLHNILKHEPKEVDIVGSGRPPGNFLKTINQYGSNLVSLTLGDRFATEAAESNFAFNANFFILPKLRELSIVNTDYFDLDNFPSQQLTYINLSCIKAFGCLDSTKGLMNLKTLIMYNVINSPDCIDWIISHSNLAILDLTVSNEEYGGYKEPTAVLKRIAVSLPKLTWLDISGTNLADTGGVIGSDIPGLLSRVGSPLDYLGLYGTMHSACQRLHIPALLISGNGNEKQILTAAMVNMNRVEMISKILNDFNESVSLENSNHIELVLNIVLNACKSHLKNKNIVYPAETILFRIVGRLKVLVWAGVSQQIIEAISKERVAKLLKNCLIDH